MSWLEVGTAARQLGRDWRRARESLDGQTQANMAEALAIGAPELSRIERGLAIPCERTVALFADWCLQFAVSVPARSSALLAHSRQTDPPSSDVAVKNIAADLTLRDAIMRYAEQVAPAAFTDNELTRHVSTMTGRSQQRNVVAKSRQLLTRDGLLTLADHRAAKDSAGIARIMHHLTTKAD